MKMPLLCVLFLAALAINTAAAESDPPASPEVTAAMKPYLDSYKLAGVIGLIADKSGKVCYKNLLGYADVEAKKPIREGNVFWIASMTKMFAGASIMMLADEGKVSLNDPVTKFIPQLGTWMANATCRTPPWRNCGRNKPERPKSITASAIICATACSATTALMAPIGR